MGQRHQVYLRLPEVYYNPRNPNNKPVTTIGIHHQWLYGQTALIMLKNFMTFWENTKDDKYSPFVKWRSSDVQGILNGIYSIDYVRGYYHSVHQLEAGCCLDPRLGDNNDGITIIDVTGENPEYCFMAICGLEGDKSCAVKDLIPLSAHQYVSAYYPHYLTETTATNFREEVVDLKEFHLETKGLIKTLANYKVLTPKQVQDIFPLMYGRKLLQAADLINATKQAPLL